jgi:outer membrane protein insertion porin family
MDEGPKVKIRTVDFTGNKAFSDGQLRRRMKENRAHWFFSWLTGRGTYQETKFEEDAQRVTEYYQDHGYVRAQVGEPQLKDMGESKDKKTKWIQLSIPVNEGNPYRVNNFQIAGNTVVKTDALMPLFKLKNGDYYSQKLVRKGFQKAQEIYGAGGYMSYGYPDLHTAMNLIPRTQYAEVARRGHANRNEADIAHRRHHVADYRGQAIPRQPDHLYRQHDDAG